ncbi:lysophospholipid acyltransferase family protein [Phaeobacter marinintestinus]|uniref:lysophospholipid acyltransferase family protein n=1 Tax=Falsiphaeobacter marinintestinus TaxID=1492905 RepID=UPI001FE4BBEF|nr:lysophospholipid acyltransferase family protein [Phaeobacter marinintestinus]
MFYRQVDVVGLHNLPTSGPVVVVANHTNSLVDGAMVSGFLPRIPRLIVASTIWAYKPLIPIMNMAGVIPIHRRSEIAGSAQKNRSTFAATTDLLAAGGMISVFPEGESHDEPRVKPLKSGTARLALRAHAEAPSPGVSIVPIGLSYDAKGRFRSRALMELGTPIPVASFVDRSSEAASTRALTQAIHSAMLDVTQNYENRDLARLVGRAAELWETPHPTLSDQPALVITAERRRDFVQRYNWLRAEHPKQTAAAWASFAAYDAALRKNSMRDVHIGAEASASDWRRFLMSSAGGLLLLFPVAVVGTVLNLLSFGVVKTMALRRDPDQRATWQVFPTIALAPFFWCLQGLLAGLCFGWVVGLVTLISGPAALPVTLNVSDRATRWLHDVRAWRKLSKDKALQGCLQAMRKDALQQLEDLATLVEDMPDPVQD